MKKTLLSQLQTGLPFLIAGWLLAIASAFNQQQDTPACAIQLDRNNLLYTHLDNPLSIVVRGVPVDQIKIEANGIELQRQDDIHYIARATTPGEAIITVSGGDLPARQFKYRIIRVPSPLLLLGAKYNGMRITRGEFCAQAGLAAVMPSEIFCGNCEIIGYEVVYLPVKEDPVIEYNTGARFTEKVQQLIQKAKPGDCYFFESVKVRCPGDLHSREMGSLRFHIK
jgi:GldM C-terminal domain